MIDPPKTIKEAWKIKYGSNSFRKGHKYNIHCCAYRVWSGFSSYQCSRKNGHGFNELYCKQHAKIVGEE